MSKINNVEKYQTFLKKWGDGIHHEIDFWNIWLNTKGFKWPNEYIRRLDPKAEIRPDIQEIIRNKKNKIVEILDVGSGPITNIGYVFEDYTLSINACDPLAGPYNTLLKKYNILPPVVTNFAMVEKLTEVYEKTNFDIVLCTNALDHSFDPIAGITEMINLVSKNGIIKLSHDENEADFESYFGFHQWNFTEKNNDFIIWNKDNEYNITKMYSAFAKVEVKRIESNRSCISVSITKFKEGADFRICPKYIIDYGLINYCAEIVLMMNPIENNEKLNS